MKKDESEFETRTYHTIQCFTPDVSLRCVVIPGPLVTMMSAMLPIILILVAVNVLLFAVLFVARFQYRTKRKEKCNQTVKSSSGIIGYCSHRDDDR